MLPEPGALGRPEVPQVRPGAERGRRTGDDDRADTVVGFERVEGVDDLVDHRGGERVALVRVVERDGGDPVGDVYAARGSWAESCTVPPRRPAPTIARS